MTSKTAEGRIVPSRVTDASWIYSPDDSNSDAHTSSVEGKQVHSSSLQASCVHSKPPNGCSNDGEHAEAVSENPLPKNRRQDDSKVFPNDSKPPDLVSEKFLPDNGYQDNSTASPMSENPSGSMLKDAETQNRQTSDAVLKDDKSLLTKSTEQANVSAKYSHCLNTNVSDFIPVDNRSIVSDSIAITAHDFKPDDKSPIVSDPVTESSHKDLYPSGKSIDDHIPVGTSGAIVNDFCPTSGLASNDVSCLVEDDANPTFDDSGFDGSWSVGEAQNQPAEARSNTLTIEETHTDPWSVEDKQNNSSGEAGSWTIEETNDSWTIQEKQNNLSTEACKDNSWTTVDSWLAEEAKYNIQVEAESNHSWATDEKPSKNWSVDSNPEVSKLEVPLPLPQDNDVQSGGITQNEQPASEEEEETYVGKWMLFFDQEQKNDEDLTLHDRAWFKIDQLVRNGLLYSAKASTALRDPLAHTPGLGLICCYTEDYRDQESVRAAADLIRKTLAEELCEKVIYYKTDSASLAGKYRILGSGRVSIYRHKPDYSFWKTSSENTSWDIVRKRNRPKFRPNSSR